MTRDMSSKENEWFKRHERQQLEDIRQQRENAVTARLAEEAEAIMAKQITTTASVSQASQSMFYIRFVK